jgi:hypothetical protein
VLCCRDPLLGGQRVLLGLPPSTARTRRTSAAESAGRAVPDAARALATPGAIAAHA